MFLSDFAIVRLTIGSLAIGFGIPGNMIIIAVFTRQSISNATDVAFIALAVVDLVGSVINGVKIAAVFFHDEHPWACFIEVIGSRSPLFASLLITTSIAAYRHRAVCNPFGKRVGRRAAAWLSLTCTVVAFSVHVPFFFITTSYKLGREYFCNVYGNIAWVQNVYARSQAVLFCASALPVTVLYALILKHIRYYQGIRREILSDKFASERTSKSETLGAVSCISKSIDMACNSSDPLSNNFSPIAMDSHTANLKPSPPHPSDMKEPASRQNLDQAQARPRNVRKSDHKTTQMLIIITAVFFLLWLPSVVLDQLSIAQISHIGSIIPRGMLYFLYQVKYVSLITNLFIYTAVNRRFRDNCKKLFLSQK
ncbi:uncharacterized protein [Diadema setosum]|uniref:uncharacterized protein n=1 Tax=Diadema setosum TaxID=31175 RepID=UPI003B3BA839